MPTLPTIQTTLRRLLAGAVLLAALACGGGGGGGSAPLAPTGSWGSAQSLENNQLFDSYYPQVAVDDTGRTVVVWFRLLSGFGDIYAKVYQPGSGWQPEGTIESMDGDGRYPVVGVGGGGAFFVAWEHTPISGSPAIFVNRYIPGTGWSGPLQISAGTTAATSAALAVDGAGNVIVAWHQLNASSQYEVQASRFNAATGSWSAPVVLGTSTVTNNFSPRVAMDPTGNGLVAWNRAQDPVNGPGAICAVLYSATSGWQIPGSVPSLQAGVEGMDDAYGCSLAMSSAGAVLGWAETLNGANYRPYARIWNPSNGTWSTAAPITTALDCSTPEVGIDASGKAYAAWVQYTGSDWNDLYVARYTPTGGWLSSAQPVDALAGGIGLFSLHVNAGGSAALSWNQVTGTVASIYALHLDPVRGWDTPRLLETSDTGSAYAPAVRLSSSGSGMVAWYQKDAAGIRHIYANRWN